MRAKLINKTMEILDKDRANWVCSEEVKEQFWQDTQVEMQKWSTVKVAFHLATIVSAIVIRSMVRS
jgi:hypothetical protein